MTDNNAVRDTIREMKRHRDKLTQQQEYDFVDPFV